MATKDFTVANTGVANSLTPDLAEDINPKTGAKYKKARISFAIAPDDLQDLQDIALIKRMEQGNKPGKKVSVNSLFSEWVRQTIADNQESLNIYRTQFYRTFSGQDKQ